MSDNRKTGDAMLDHEPSQFRDRCRWRGDGNLVPHDVPDSRFRSRRHARLPISSSTRSSAAIACGKSPATTPNVPYSS